jgi:hypothetical protein
MLTHRLCSLPCRLTQHLVALRSLLDSRTPAVRSLLLPLLLPLLPLLLLPLSLLLLRLLLPLCPALAARPPLLQPSTQLRGVEAGGGGEEQAVPFLVSEGNDAAVRPAGHAVLHVGRGRKGGWGGGGVCVRGGGGGSLAGGIGEVCTRAGQAQCGLGLGLGLGLG